MDAGGGRWEVRDGGGGGGDSEASGPLTLAREVV